MKRILTIFFGIFFVFLLFYLINSPQSKKLLKIIGNNPSFKNFKVPPEIENLGKIHISDEELLTSDEKEEIGKLKNFTDVFTIKRAVKLEVTEDSAIGEISKLVYLNNKYFIIDGIQNQVFMFDNNGKYLRKMGRKGDGPGEYQLPYCLEKVFGNQIGVFCGMTGRVHVYNTDGNYVKSLNPYSPQGALIKGWNFIWKEESKLYISDFILVDEAAPNNILIDPTRNNEILSAFGKRSFYLDYEIRLNWKNDAFEMIGDYIWVGSPYSSHISIFDKNAHKVKEWGHRSEDRLAYDEVLDLKDRKSEKAQSLFLKKRNDAIQATKKIVAVQLSRNVDLYDKKGERIGQDLKFGMFTTLLDSNDSYIYTALPTLYKISETFPKEILKHLVEAGLDVNDMKDDNPYVIVLESQYDRLQ